ncbi:MAG: hypothetical protein QOC99_3923 [Acidobacteriota bacterium]|jgi:hypothetical protein|nr:hypothetical protein [Acidobacteriota bacterium]
MRTLLLFIFAAVMSSMAVATRAQNPAAQSGQRAAQDKRTGSSATQSATASQTQPATAPKELTVAEKVIVQGSREAILKSGITEPYFDNHFRVERVFNNPGDRRVVWRFSVNGYEATVSDTLGFYTEGGKRVDTHSVASTLPSTSDITRTITRRQAERIMRRCIGKFTNPHIEYRAHGADGRAALLFTAQNIMAPPTGRGRAARERREREEREEREVRAGAQGQAGGGGHQLDVIEAEGNEWKRRPVILLGAVDLVTGKCMMGRAQSTP